MAPVTSSESKLYHIEMGDRVVENLEVDYFELVKGGTPKKPYGTHSNPELKKY